MTATVPPPAGPEAPPREPSDDQPATGHSRALGRNPDIAPHLWCAELALALLTAAAVVGFARIFDSWSFLWPLLAVTATTHATTKVTRRRGWTVPAAFVATAVQWVLVVTWLFFVDTTLALVPTRDTWDTAGAELQRSWTSFHEVVAPAPVQTGFLLAASLAVAAGIFLSDWAAFRLWSAREAVVPPLALFVFATLLAEGGHRVLSAALFVAAGIGFVLTHRVVVLERSEAWVQADHAAGGRRLLAAGLALGTAAVLLGAVVAPLLPGADDEAIVDWARSGDGSGDRVVLSQLVDIKARIVNTSDTEAFRVRADAPAYWRTTAYDRFDGELWGASNSYDLADGELPGVRSVGRDSRQLTQSFEIQGLVTEQLPAAYTPTRVAPPSGTSVRFDPRTATLLVDGGQISTGATYRVTSLLADYTPEQLRTASTDVPRAVRETSVGLPAGFSPTATLLARQVVEDAGAASAYDQALALQDWFREGGGFRYDIEVPPGQGEAAIDTFLQDRVGYCEQFAGTFAAMARTLGIPSRVAVGYTWGEELPGEPGTYQVRGRNAHAWPEVFLGQYGWVTFEPTPGRGAPGTEGWTGIAPAQAGDAAAPDVTTTTTLDPNAAPAPTTTLAGDESALAPEGAGGSTSALLGPLLVGLLVAVVGAGAYLLAVPGTIALRHRHRRAAATTPVATVGVAWVETAERLRASRVGVRPDETHGEVADRAGRSVPAAAGALHELARLADAAAYGSAALDDADADAARREADTVAAALDAHVSWWDRIRSFLDPRPLWTERPRRHRAD